MYLHVSTVVVYLHVSTVCMYLHVRTVCMFLHVRTVCMYLHVRTVCMYLHVRKSVCIYMYYSLCVSTCTCSVEVSSSLNRQGRPSTVYKLGLCLSLLRRLLIIAHDSPGKYRLQVYYCSRHCAV